MNYVQQAPNLAAQSASLMAASGIPLQSNLDSAPTIEIIENNAVEENIRENQDQDYQEYREYDQESRQMDIPLPDEEVT